MATMSPLGRRVIDDMMVRDLSPATRQSDIDAVTTFSRHFNRSPDRLGLEDVPATAAATGTAPSARAPLPATGWPNAKPTCCRSAISMSSSRFPPKLRT